MLIWPTPLREDMDLSPESIDEQVDTTRTSLSDTFYESRANLIIGVTLSLFVVSAIFVGLRVYVRAFVLRKWGIDDTMLVSSFIIVLFHDFVMCLATKFGIGRHFWTIPFRTLLQGQKLCMFIIVLYNVAFTAIKITFLFQYRRIFPLPKIELLCNIGIAFLSLFGISLVISTAVTYTLLFTNAYFDSSINILTWWIVNASIHLITDIFIFLLPMPLLGQLRLHKVQKLALFASFSLGFFTCAISIIRIISLPESLRSTDPTFDSAPTIVWTVAELSSAVICCCVPTLRPLVQRSRYLAGRGAHSGSVFNSTPLSRCNSQHHTGRMSSLISWASDTAVRKPKPSFSWNRSRQRSEQLTITEVDDIEPAPATPMMPVAPRLSAFRTTPVEPAMPRLEINGVRRESGASIHNEGNWMKRNSTRGSICSEGSIANTENSVRRDLSVRRHMSIALTERDSDDDVYYFGVREEDVNCPTPLSPPPKYSK